MFRVLLGLVLVVLIYLGVKEWRRCKKLQAAEQKQKEAEIELEVVKAEEKVAAITETTRKRKEKLESKQ